MFTRRLIDLSTTVERMHHHITHNTEAKAVRYRQHTNFSQVPMSTSASKEREYDVMECQEKVGTEFYHVPTPTSASEERERDVNAMWESARKRDSNVSQKVK